jgi:cell division protein FtsA
MIKKNFDIFFYLTSQKLIASVFKKISKEVIFFETQDCPTILHEDKYNLIDTEKYIQQNIFNIEKSTGEFVNDIHLIVDTDDSKIIEVSLMKNIEGKMVDKKDVQYLVQDAKQQVLRFNPDKNIIHIIITKYIFDKKEYKFLPDDLNCKNFSIDIKFVCFSEILVKKLNNLFNRNQILINKLICAKYVKSFDHSKNEFEANICNLGLQLVGGLNKQEVIIIPKKVKKKGFFEKIFLLFD